MIKDKIKLYYDYSEFTACPFCKQYSHLPSLCPKLFYFPDKNTHIKRFQYSKDQERHININRFEPKKKSHNARKNLFVIQKSLINFNENIEKEEALNENEEISEVSEFDEIPPKELRRESLLFPDSKDERKPPIFLSKADFLLNYEEKTPPSFKEEIPPNIMKSRSQKKENDFEDIHSNFDNEKKDLFFYDFDKMMNYKFYFPQNNLSYIMEKYFKVFKPKVLKRSNRGGLSPRRNAIKILSKH